jgi:hypothetical protein
MKEIPLTHGYIAIVDDDDFEKFGNRKYQTHFNHKKCYAITSGERRGERVLLHRLIMGCVKDDGKICDHINGDSLDNRKENLRFTTFRGNIENSSMKITGAAWNGRDRLWQARIMINGKRRSLGCYKTKEEAMQVYQSVRVSPSLSLSSTYQ